jgi:hypothetical protein
MIRYQCNTKAFFFILMAAIVLSACAAQKAAQMPSAGQGAPPAEVPAGEFGAADQADNAFSANQPSQETQRLVIKNANMSLVVEDPGQSMDAIGRMAEEMGGFVVSANLSQNQLQNGDQVSHASIRIRVPAEQLDEALQRIESLSDRTPLNKSVEGQDVTQEYTDLQSQLRNLENAEAQLREIMDSATRTEDVLAVYRQLVDVREQIEVTQGRIQYFEKSAAMSSIQVELMADEAVQPLTIGRWQPAGVAKNAVQALISVGQFLVNAAIWIVILVLPVLLVLAAADGIPIMLVLRIWRRRRAGKEPDQGNQAPS